MSWQDMVGGLVNQVTGNKDEEKEGGGLLGMAGSLLGALGGDKQQVLGQLMGKLSASGVDVNALLEKLGINPDEASDEDLERLASHVQENAEETPAEASDDSASAETAETNEEVAETTESSDEPTSDFAEAAEPSDASNLSDEPAAAEDSDAAEEPAEETDEETDK